jgi:pyruvate formate lyase activating enzyme
VEEKEIKTPLILDIKGNSLDDGPGIRTVVFFKGCPLSCVWCHNPESKKASVEIAFDRRLCIDCGACREVCPREALSKNNPFYIDRSKCTLCFLCADACPAGALDRVGKKMSIDDILQKILPDKPFFDTSGGGVTLSGGEPTLYMEFASTLLCELKRQNIHTLLETCGFFDMDKFMVLLYPHLDAVYYDIKIIDNDAHRKYCGVPNEKILDNFRTLAAAARNDGKVLLPRIPLVPAITDTPANVRGIAAFLKQLRIPAASFLEYNPLWHEKSDKVGADDPYKADKAMTSFPTKDVLQACRKILTDAGICVEHPQ